MKAYLFFDPPPEEPEDRDPMDTPDYINPNVFVKQMRAATEAIEAEETVNTRLSAMVINVMAAEERRQRLVHLAATSAGRITPSATIHAQIDQILDETDITDIPRGRPAPSREMEDD